MRGTADRAGSGVRQCADLAGRGMVNPPVTGAGDRAAVGERGDVSVILNRIAAFNRAGVGDGRDGFGRIGQVQTARPLDDGASLIVDRTDVRVGLERVEAGDAPCVLQQRQRGKLSEAPVARSFDHAPREIADGAGDRRRHQAVVTGDLAGVGDRAERRAAGREHAEGPASDRPRVGERVEGRAGAHLHADTSAANRPGVGDLSRRAGGDVDTAISALDRAGIVKPCEAYDTHNAIRGRS